ncbi:MAG: Fe3+-citrate ABC transporter substrate-binding protein [Clostridium butyricum]|nr:Fe3+-citrate ABC transporter substrate-binding protein [Clostridium butyricum]
MLSLLAFTFLTGCGQNTSSQSQSNDESQTTEENTGKKVITDQVGHEVEIPNEVNRVVITSLWPLPSVYCLFQGSGEALVGMHPASKSAAENSLLTKVAPEISEVSTGFIQNGELNVEELIKLKPDVVFGSSDTEYEMVTKAGIPYVQFVANPTGTGNTIEAVGQWMKLLGDIFNKEDRAEEVMNYGNETLKEIEEKLSTVSDDDKVRALMIYKYSDGTMQVSGKNFFGDFWLKSGGAINVAEEIDGPKEVNMEQIYKWNPNKIYITNFSSYLPEDFYNNVIEGDDWSNVKAVQDKEVHKIPLGMYRWFPPSSDTSLMLKWVAKQNYPEIFSDVDMNQEVKDYYMKFYGIELNDEEVEKVFNPSREAANGV